MTLFEVSDRYFFKFTTDVQGPPSFSKHA